MNQPSSPASPDPLLAALLARITRIRRDADSQQITRAYEAAAYWHEGQNRRSGDPYITHPVAVAEILADVGESDQTLCAANVARPWAAPAELTPACSDGWRRRIR